MRVERYEPDQARVLEQFRIERCSGSSMPSMLGTRLMALLLGNIPLRLVPHLSQGPKGNGF